MVDDDETWTELRYSGRQVLPAADGIADELDAVVWWDVAAVRTGPGAEQVVGTGAVAILDLSRPTELLRAVTAYGGPVAHVASVVLTPVGGLAPGLAATDVDQVLLFLGVDVTAGSADTGLPLRSADLVRKRLTGPATLIASYPQPHTEDAGRPAFLERVPADVRAAWAARGLRHVGGGVWTLPVRPV